jgi:hypothetical protein
MANFAKCCGRGFAPAAGEEVHQTVLAPFIDLLRFLARGGAAR